MNDDQYDGIFDNLNPNDFIDKTTAIHERPMGFSDDLYEVYLDRNICSVRYAFASAVDNDINPMATLANGAIERTFAPEDDETLGQFIARLAREAGLMRAEWLFISVQTRVGTVLLSSDESAEFTADDPNHLAQADNMGSTQDAVYWYSQRTDSLERPRRHGFLVIDGQKLGRNVEGEADQPVTAYAGILG